MKRLFLKVEGIVQGVGFRPFVYNHAVSLNLKGWINNNSEGVHIDIEGKENRLYDFIDILKHNHPPLARIENITVEEKEFINYSCFEIRESERNDEKITFVSPDMAVCKDCIKDISDSLNKRYKYPFTNCTNCGPRFSIIKSIPYDRDNTTMNKFKMCDHCYEEYTNPLNRRFHAQPNACEDCGPHIWIEDSRGYSIEVEDVVQWAKEKLKEGKVFAIKGLTGFHLVCDAANEEAVKLLRVRKKRPHKPFAVMMKDIETVKKYCYINNEEENILCGRRKPIVLLDKIHSYNLPESIASHQKTLGVMLPNTPLHHLLFSGNIEILIMTSANVHGLPLEYMNESAVEKLGDIVDYFLMHNRDIYIPVDDSVVKVIDNEVHVIRRARGYAPEPIKQSNVKPILACGPNMKNTFCIAKENFLLLSQHNGDLENIETIEHYKNNMEHFKKIFSFEPEYIACDMHPGYMSTQYAYDSNLPRIEVQHHHAHIVSCIAENNINGKVIGVAFDGTGYGIDGKMWGGEFLLCDTKDFKRLGHLDYVKMPGGDITVKEPWRMAVAYICNMFKLTEHLECSTSEKLKELLFELYGNKAVNLKTVIDADINCFETSSIGRFFDAAASLIGFRDVVTYEGQGAIELETIACTNCSDFYNYNIIEGHQHIIQTHNIISGIIEDRRMGIPQHIISAKFHNSIIMFTIDLCNIIRKATGVNKVALSGGVFQNSYILKNLARVLRESEFIVYTNKLVPTNDGGISLGQMVIANEILNNK
ncbi:carbamoyltransferase HypF [Clostridium sp. DJ247]|uniref:carbamoyltransferase HypF n=1 Tax=Clostridium sp. DJ247 TaxID=2726188 RepID=UPI0016291865|nr:carbamoyltransferase HypF [Clostridium sp. DJ247]MBC2582144.1 carbamoyltransferase HypF [Clostridium sp. DJ247]